MPPRSYPLRVGLNLRCSSEERAGEREGGGGKRESEIERERETVVSGMASNKVVREWCPGVVRA